MEREEGEEVEHFLIMWAPWIVIIVSIVALFGWGAKGDTK